MINLTPSRIRRVLQQVRYHNRTLALISPTGSMSRVHRDEAVAVQQFVAKHSPTCQIVAGIDHSRVRAPRASRTYFGSNHYYIAALMPVPPLWVPFLVRFRHAHYNRNEYLYTIRTIVSEGDGGPQRDEWRRFYHPEHLYAWIVQRLRTYEGNFRGRDGGTPVLNLRKSITSEHARSWSWQGSRQTRGLLRQSRETLRSLERGRAQYDGDIARTREQIATLQQQQRQERRARTNQDTDERLLERVRNIAGVSAASIHGRALIVDYHPAICRLAPTGSRVRSDRLNMAVSALFIEPFRLRLSQGDGFCMPEPRLPALSDETREATHPHVGCSGAWESSLASCYRNNDPVGAIAVVAEWRRVYGAGSLNAGVRSCVAHGLRRVGLMQSPLTIDVDGQLQTWDTSWLTLRPLWTPDLTGMMIRATFTTSGSLTLHAHTANGRSVRMRSSVMVDLARRVAGQMPTQQTIQTGSHFRLVSRETLDDYRRHRAANLHRARTSNRPRNIAEHTMFHDHSVSHDHGRLRSSRHSMAQETWHRTMEWVTGQANLPDGAVPSTTRLPRPRVTAEARIPVSADDEEHFSYHASGVPHAHLGTMIHEDWQSAQHVEGQLGPEVSRPLEDTPLTPPPEGRDMAEDPDGPREASEEAPVTEETVSASRIGEGLRSAPFRVLRVGEEVRRVGGEERVDPIPDYLSSLERLVAERNEARSPPGTPLPWFWDYFHSRVVCWNCTMTHYTLNTAVAELLLRYRLLAAAGSVEVDHGLYLRFLNNLTTPAMFGLEHQSNCHFCGGSHLDWIEWGRVGGRGVQPPPADTFTSTSRTTRERRAN